jgi:murein DD-endopeptidase MepM/ murein hydrolase activator NlpD
VLVTVTGVDRMPRGTGGKVALVFFPISDGWQAIFAVPLDDKLTELKVSIGAPRLGEILTIEPRKWDEEQVKIDPEMAEPPADKRKIINADNTAIIKAIADRSPPRFTAGFARPGNGEKTSTFGAWRTLNGDYRSRHLGLDFGVRKGTPVHVIQDGKVALVSSGFLTGGTVVVTHGAGIASTYFHLDDIKVAIGDTIERGTAIGKVGMTGRTTGPHIHIGIWVPGGFIDPDAFFKLKIGPPVAPAAKPAAKK